MSVSDVSRSLQNWVLTTHRSYSQLTFFIFLKELWIPGINNCCNKEKQKNKKRTNKKRKTKKQSRDRSGKNNFSVGNYRLRRAERWEYMPTTSPEVGEISMCMINIWYLVPVSVFYDHLVTRHVRLLDLSYCLQYALLVYFCPLLSICRNVAADRESLCETQRTSTLLSATRRRASVCVPSCPSFVSQHKNAIPIVRLDVSCLT